MKKIGKEVLFLKTSQQNPRNGESTMARLTDGRIMFVYTEYYGDGWEDHCTARISACYSSDEGESWSASEVIVQKPEEAQNIMSPSLLRLPDGALGMIYLRKDVQEDMGVSCMPMFIRSEDEGKSWSEAVVCGMPLGYYCGINDGVLVTRDGRILMPMSYHGERHNALGKMKKNDKWQAGDIRVACSEDSGKTWYAWEKIFVSPFIDDVGLAEPGLFELDNGDLWLYMRTAYGHQYQSLSYDGGKSWTPVEPNCRFTAPDAPMRVKKVGAYVAAVYNPVAFNCLRTDGEVWGSPRRTPLVVSISKNGAVDFTNRRKTFCGNGYKDIVANTYFIEDDTSDSYCYPSILETKDGFLVSYYHSDGSNVCLNASKIVKVYFSEIE